MRSYLAANGRARRGRWNDNFSPNGRSDERFAGLMEEKIGFSSGYLLFEIWKSEVKKREEEAGWKGETGQAGMGESIHEVSVGYFDGSSAPFGRVGTMWCGRAAERVGRNPSPGSHQESKLANYQTKFTLQIK